MPESNKGKAALKLSWDELHRIQEKAVERGLDRRAEEKEGFKHVGVDEKSFLKKHKYATMVYDLDRSCVVEVAKDRKEESKKETI